MIKINKKLLIFVDFQVSKMKNGLFILAVFMSLFSFSQEKDKEALLAQKKANGYVYQGNELLNEDEFVSAEMEYRKAISKQTNNVAGAYNLGNSYYRKGNFNEALYRHQQALQNAISKTEKHSAFHNIGNILMQNKQCKAAVEAFKNALRNDPTDDETRYNFALAKECAEEQQDQQDDQDKQDENKDENKEEEDKENKDKEGDDKEEPKDEGEEDKKEGDENKDEEGKPKDENNDKGEGDKEKKEEKKPQQPKPTQMSPQQIKNLLEAMNNQEQKVQEKMNAEKQKGVILQNEKDW